MAAGSAEQTFFTVCGAKSTHKRHYNCDAEEEEDEDESDEENVAQRRRLLSDGDDGAKSVRASIKVILLNKLIRVCSSIASHNNKDFSDPTTSVTQKYMFS